MHQSTVVHGRGANRWFPAPIRLSVQLGDTHNIGWLVGWFEFDDIFSTVRL